MARKNAPATETTEETVEQTVPVAETQTEPTPAEPVTEQPSPTEPAEPTPAERRASLRAQIAKARHDFIKGNAERDSYLTEELERRAASKVADHIEALRAELDGITE
jgi:hypothetical protein